MACLDVCPNSWLTQSRGNQVLAAATSIPPFRKWELPCVHIVIILLHSDNHTRRGGNPIHMTPNKSCHSCLGVGHILNHKQHVLSPRVCKLAICNVGNLPSRWTEIRKARSHHWEQRLRHCFPPMRRLPASNFHRESPRRYRFWNLL